MIRNPSTAIAHKVLTHPASALIAEHPYIVEYIAPAAEGGTAHFVLNPKTADRHIQDALIDELTGYGGARRLFPNATQLHELAPRSFALYPVEEPGKARQLILSVSGDLLEKAVGKHTAPAR